MSSELVGLLQAASIGKDEVCVAEVSWLRCLQGWSFTDLVAPLSSIPSARSNLSGTTWRRIIPFEVVHTQRGQPAWLPGRIRVGWGRCVARCHLTHRGSAACVRLGLSVWYMVCVYLWLCPLIGANEEHWFISIWFTSLDGDGWWWWGGWINPNKTNHQWEQHFSLPLQKKSTSQRCSSRAVLQLRGLVSCYHAGCP